MSHNINCKILDEDDIDTVKQNTQEFRKWSIDTTEKRTFPFDRYQKKEFPFLFKKKHIPKEETSKISLNEIITKVKDLSMNSPVLASIQDNVDNCRVDIPMLDLDDSPKTPTYAPIPLTQEEINYVKQLDLYLKSNSTLNKDGTQ